MELKWNDGWGWALAGVLMTVACGTDSSVNNAIGHGTVDPRTVNVGGSLAGVDPLLDTDGDGRTDLMEGTGDADGDFIPAHLDADELGGAPAAGTTGTAPGGASGAPTTPGTLDGGAPNPALDGGTAPMVCEPGPTPGNSVLLIGDSYLALNNNAFGTKLQELARAEGALAAGDMYIDRSVAGSEMVSSAFNPLTPIPTQYENENNADGHIKTVVMTGGGNDVLVSQRSCIENSAPPANQQCVDTIEQSFAAAQKLLQQMAADGVENVVYFFYPHLPGGGLGGNKQLTRQTIDYALERTDGVNLPQLCAQAPLNCQFVDTRGLFPAEVAEFQDGVHPIVENTHKISEAVWQTMKAHCIAQ